MKQVQLELVWKFKFTGMLIPIILSFNVLSQFSKFNFFKKAEVINLKPCCCGMGAGSQASCHSTCQSHDLSLTASLTLSCHPGVTVFFFALQQDGNARCWPARPGHCNNLKCWTSGMEGLFLLCCCHHVCYDISIRFHTHK